VGSSSPEMWVARRLWCLAFVVFGGLPSVRGEGRGKREICLKMWEESVVFNLGREEERVTSF
jgi:hypothetical protein